MQAYADKDVAMKSNLVFVLQTSTSFKAVMHYRLANIILNSNKYNEDLVCAGSLAINISNRGKLLSGAEIHPAAKIGRRFVLDHGLCTVFGETTEVGDDCYILGGVILGARGISNNPIDKRHPTIGNRVQIGALSRVFGNVVVGDDVFIGPNCVVDKNIGSGCRVVAKSNINIL